MAKYTVGAVVYQGAFGYLREFFESIARNHLDKDTDILILNDNCDINELNNLVSDIISDELYKILDYSARDYKMTPALFRMELLKQAKLHGTELLIVGDCDDRFTPERVNSLIATHKASPKAPAFYYGDLLYESGEKIFTSLPDMVERDTVIKEIAQGNFLGMGTCAINMSLLSDAYILSLCDADVTAYDWYLFTRLIMDIAPGRYVPDSGMIYRIYDGNAAGVIKDFNSKNLARELEFKRIHYEMLGKRYAEYRALSDKLGKLLDEGGRELNFWEQYRSKADNGLWWNLVEI